MKTLGEAGFENYVAGECVIDSLMGEKPYSWDVITEASYDKLAELFPEAKVLSAKYSVLREEKIEEILDEKGNSIGEEGYIIDISSYRKKNVGDAAEGENIFTDKVEEDLRRRDFTADAIALNPYVGEKSVADPYEGREDIRKKIIKTIGEANASAAHDESDKICGTIRLRLAQKCVRGDCSKL